MNALALSSAVALLALELLPSAAWATMVSSASAQSPISLSLERCVELGLANATLAIKSRAHAESAGVALLQGYAQFLPNLEAAADFSRQWGNSYLTEAAPILQRSDNYGGNLQLSSTLNLFNGFGDAAALHAALDRDRAARLSLERARQAVALDVAQSYLQVVLDRQLLRIQESGLKDSKQREAFIGGRAELGQATYVDLYQQQAQSSASEQRVIAARTKARDDLFVLLEKIRADVRKDYALEDVSIDTAEAGPGAEPALVAYALDHRADLAAAKEAASAAGADLSGSRQGYFPTLDLAFGAASAARHYNQEVINGVNALPPSQEPLGPQFGEHVNYSLGLSLNWGIFDRLSTKLRVARAREALKDAEVDYDDALLQTEGQVRQAYGDLLAARQSLSSAELGRAAAGKAYEAMDARYAVGSASFLDLISAQVVFIQAQAASVEALIEFDLQRRGLAFALGDDPGAAGSAR